MKIVTANRLSDGRVIYADEAGEAVESLSLAARMEDAEAEDLLARVASLPGVFVGAYLVEVTEARPSGRDRLKETIRSTGPTVGHSVGFA